MARSSRLCYAAAILLCLFLSSQAYAQQAPVLPDFGIGSETGPNPQDVSITLQLLFLLTILSLLPSIAVMVTPFIRISIVLGFVRRAIGTQQTPSNEIIVGLSLFLTLYIIAPVLEEIYNTAVQPFLNGEMESLEPGDQDAYGLPVTERIPPFLSCCNVRSFR